MQFSQATIDAVETLQRRKLARSTGRAVTESQVIRAVQSVLEVAQAGNANPRRFSLSRMIRGMAVMKGKPLNHDTREEDVAYCRALQTGQTPGSYIVPVIQADEIIGLLSLGAVHRAAGARVWTLVDVQELNVPTALTSPTFQFLPQNTQQAPDSATNFGQMSFNLLEHRALIEIPVQLLRTSVPTFDQMLAEFFALGAGESESVAMFAASTQSNSPTALLSAAGITVLNAAGNSANGGNLLYTDLTMALEKSAEAKVKPPLAWFASPRTFNRLLSLQSSTSQPILTPAGGLQPQSHFNLLHWPLFLTTAIPNNLSVGSGTNQSYLVLTRPSLINVAEDRSLSIDLSLEFLFDSHQAALRVAHRVDFSYTPSAGIVVLQGIN